MNISTEPLYPPYSLVVGVISEKGSGRDLNEDAYRIEPQIGLFLIADGMGGHQAGEVASRLAVDILYQTLSASSASSLKEALVPALLSAHQAIRSMAEEKETYRGMGTTALIGWVRVPELTLWTGHIGNCRAYLWRDGMLRRLTEDHTMLNELRKANRLPADPRDWPSPVVLSQALGSRQPVLSPDLGEWPLQIGDRLLFCSDGISDVLTDDEINAILSGAGTPQAACEQLAQAAKDKGGRDDITAIVVHIQAPQERRTVQILQMQMLEVEK